MVATTHGTCRIHYMMNEAKQGSTMPIDSMTRFVSDLHKDAFGFRPDPSFWNEWNQADNEHRRHIWNNLLAVMEYDQGLSEEEGE